MTKNKEPERIPRLECPRQAPSQASFPRRGAAYNTHPDLEVEAPTKRPLLVAKLWRRSSGAR